MSIGRRLIDLARAELNSLLERAARAEDDDDFGSPTDHLSDKELEEELERRRQARQEAEHAAQGTRPEPAAGERAGVGASSGRRRPEFRRAGGSEAAAIRQAYADLEVPQGSDFETVRRAYRMQMRKFHPDLHAATPEKQKTANQITQKLTDSYKLLEKKLRR